MDSVSYTALSPLSFLERSARVWPGKTAVVYGARRLTYRELAAEVQRVARALRASGVRPGDRVAYLMPNLPEMLIAHFAVPLAGAVLVAVNTRLTAEEVAYILNHSGAKIMIVDAAFLPTAAAAAKGVEAVTELVVAEDAELAAADPDPSDEPRLVNYAEFLARGTGEPLSWSVSDELAPIAINYTSGTTGRRERRDLYAPRCLPELFRRDHPLPARREQRLSVDTADVPLQRLVHPLVTDRHRRHARVPARSPRRRDLGTAARARRHPPQRGPDRGEHHPERARRPAR